MFFTERIKEWLRPRPPPLPKEEAEALSAKVDIGEDGTTGMIHKYIHFDPSTKYQTNCT